MASLRLPASMDNWTPELQASWAAFLRERDQGLLDTQSNTELPTMPGVHPLPMVTPPPSQAHLSHPSHMASQVLQSPTPLDPRLHSTRRLPHKLSGV